MCALAGPTGQPLDAFAPAPLTGLRRVQPRFGLQGSVRLTGRFCSTPQS